jgi:hypothetical protein
VGEPDSGQSSSACGWRELDLYLSNCCEAEQFGRRTMSVAVIRRGWNPTALPGEAQRR